MRNREARLEFHRRGSRRLYVYTYARIKLDRYSRKNVSRARGVIPLRSISLNYSSKLKIARSSTKINRTRDVDPLHSKEDVAYSRETSPSLYPFFFPRSRSSYERGCRGGVLARRALLALYRETGTNWQAAREMRYGTCATNERINAYSSTTFMRLFICA